MCVLEHRLDCLQIIINTSTDCLDLLNLEIENFDGFTPLHLAVRHGQLDFIKCLVDGGASPYATDAKTGDTILHTAVEHSALEITKYILETFIDKDLVNMANRADYTPLQVLVGNYTEDGADDEEIPMTDLIIANYLIKKGAKADGLPGFVLKKIHNVPDDVVIVEVNPIVAMSEPIPGPSTLRDTVLKVEEQTIQVVESTAIPLKFDNMAREELTNILKVDDLWRKTAILLDMESIVSVWESTNTPVGCLLDYIQVKV